MRKRLVLWVMLGLLFGITRLAFGDAYVIGNHIEADTVNANDLANVTRTVPLLLTAFTIYGADYPTPITHTTSPGLDLNNESASIVWNTTETSKTFVTFRVPDDYQALGNFRALMDRSDNSTRPQVDYEMLVSADTAAWDASVTSHTPVTVTTIAGTPEWTTLSLSTDDQATLGDGKAVTFRVWNSGNTTGNNLEMYYVEFYYTADR